MKLHDLRPADGSRKERIRVGRGIAAGKGKTAGRGTKGQKARAGGGIPPWFEGGQTPLHMRIPKLRGFKNRFKVEYEVVNVGAIQAAVERGAFEAQTSEPKGAKGKAKADAQLTVNQDLLRAVGLVRSLDKPLKILGTGELSTALFVVADGFTASARAKIEAAGGSVNVLEIPTRPMKAIGVDQDTETTDAGSDPANAPATEASADVEAAPARAPRTPRGKGATAAAEAATAEPTPDTAETVDPETDAPVAAAETETDEPSATESADADAPEAETASGDDA